MNKSIVLYLLLAGLLTCFSCTHTKQQPEEEGVDSEWLDSLQHVYQYGICIDSLDVTEYKMRNGDNPAAIFSALGFSALKADSITKASIHDQNNLIFTFTSNNYVNTLKKASYEYMLEGFDKKWIPSKDNNIFYTNLNPGKYTLIVREIQYDPNQEQPRTIKMDIHIHSPWYASNLAYFLYFILIISIL